jgi:hypothetical protein
MNWEQREYIGITWPTHQKMPEPYQEIDHNEFIRLMFCSPYSLEGIFYRQLWVPGDDTRPRPVRFFWYPDYGLAATEKYVLKDYYDKQMGYFWVPNGGSAGHELRFFRIGCEHHFVELTPAEIEQMNILYGGSHDHVHQCTDCGHITNTNSS